MSDSKEMAIYCSVIFFIFAVWQYKRIFNISCSGIFFISQLFFILIGILVSPWLVDDYLPKSYPYINWSIITNQDIENAVFFATFSLVAALAGHIYVDLLRLGTNRRNISVWSGILRRPEIIKVGFKWLRLFVLSCICLTIAFVTLLAKWNIVVSGIYMSYLSGQVSAFYESRLEIAELGWLYFMLTFNALPFLSVLSFLSLPKRPHGLNKILTWGLIIITGFFLLVTFQKRPLIVFIVSIILAFLMRNHYLNLGQKKSPTYFRGPLHFIKSLPWAKIIALSLIPFGALFWFFQKTTNIISDNYSTTAIFSIIGVTLDRILGRLAVMTILYVAYFPKVRSHYGIDNIGKLKALTGGELFPDTIIVSRFFTGLDKGGGAIGALVDFYGAFGMGMGLFCSFILGSLLNIIDHWILGLSPTLLNKTLALFMLLFSYYLSQASLARSVSTYGAGVFLVIWFILSIKINLTRRLMP